MDAYEMCFVGIVIFMVCLDTRLNSVHMNGP